MYGGWSAGSGFESSWGIDVTGAGVVVAATEEVEIGAFLVDAIYGEPTGANDTDTDLIGHGSSSLVQTADASSC